MAIALHSAIVILSLGSPLTPIPKHFFFLLSPSFFLSLLYLFIFSYSLLTFCYVLICVPVLFVLSAPLLAYKTLYIPLEVGYTLCCILLNYNGVRELNLSLMNTSQFLSSSVWCWWWAAERKSRVWLSSQSVFVSVHGIPYNTLKKRYPDLCHGLAVAQLAHQ